MGKTKIQWSDMTWPVVTGCTPCSIGCTNCYAARMAATRLKHHPRYEGLATISNGKARWTDKINFNYDVLEQPLRWRKPRRVFVASMGDLFHPRVPDDFIIEVFVRMEEAHHHIYQLLTKRPRRMFDFISKSTWGVTPLSNVQGLVTVENQAAADKRIPWLLRTPFAVRGVSVEPCLSGIDLTPWLRECGGGSFPIGLPRQQPCLPASWHQPPLDWVICGGESGPGARPMHPDWARSLRDQCQAAGVPFFFKQWGEWLGVDYVDKVNDLLIWKRADGLHAYFHEKPSINFGDGHGAIRVGKKRAGHLLDGRTWQQFPVADGAGTE